MVRGCYTQSACITKSQMQCSKEHTHTHTHTHTRMLPPYSACITQSQMSNLEAAKSASEHSRCPVAGCRPAHPRCVFFTRPQHKILMPEHNTHFACMTQSQMSNLEAAKSASEHSRCPVAGLLIHAASSHTSTMPSMNVTRSCARVSFS